jgi:putative FmdB family regulatory protein
MPVYEFRCRSCEAEFEVLVRSGDVPACPSCGGRDLERLLSMFAVSSAARSQASLAAARKRYQESKNRRDRVRHQAEEIREHVQDDYGIDLGAKPPGKTAT